jgi:single-strand DNA-binding protein
MKMSLNKVMVMGRLGKDVEIRRTQQGKAVASFSIGCSEKYTDKSGQKQEKTEWIRCTAWEKTAEIIAQYFHKGDGIFIEGKFRTDVKEENGAKTYHSYVLVESFTFPEGKSPNSVGQQSTGYQQPYQQQPQQGYAPQQQGYGQPQQGYQQQPQYNAPQMPTMEDDLPF